MDDLRSATPLQDGSVESLRQWLREHPLPHTPPGRMRRAYEEGISFALSVIHRGIGMADDPYRKADEFTEELDAVVKRLREIVETLAARGKYIRYPMVQDYRPGSSASSPPIFLVHVSDVPFPTDDDWADVSWKPWKPTDERTANP